MEVKTIDTAGIAQMLGRTRPYVTDRLTKQPGFPSPVINRSRRLRRWLVRDVEAWAAKGQP